MKAGKVIRKILLGLLIFLAVLTVTAVGTLWALREKGRKELYFSAENKGPSPETEEAQDPESTEAGDEDTVLHNGERYRYNEDILTFLVMGIDRKGKLPDPEKVRDYTRGGQADALFLVVVNPHTETVSLVAVNRNAMGEVDIYDADNNYIRTDLLQVCLQHGYGSGLEDSCEREVQTVSRLFYDLPVHGYVSVDIKAVPEINDSVGGVDVESVENIPKGSGLLKDSMGKTVHLTGQDAYYYVQYRDTKTFNSVALRMKRQKQYLGALARKVIARTKEDITFPLTLMNRLSGYLVTDISTSELTYMATAYLGYHFDLDHIYTLTGETVVGGGGFEEFYVDEENLNNLIFELFFEKVL